MGVVQAPACVVTLGMESLALGGTSLGGADARGTGWVGRAVLGHRNLDGRKQLQPVTSRNTTFLLHFYSL